MKMLINEQVHIIKFESKSTPIKKHVLEPDLLQRLSKIVFLKTVLQLRQNHAITDKNIVEIF